MQDVHPKGIFFFILWIFFFLFSKIPVSNICWKAHFSQLLDVQPKDQMPYELVCAMTMLLKKVKLCS